MIYYLSIYPSIHPPIHLSIHPSTHLLNYLAINHPYICPSSTFALKLWQKQALHKVLFYRILQTQLLIATFYSFPSSLIFISLQGMSNEHVPFVLLKQFILYIESINIPYSYHIHLFFLGLHSRHMEVPKLGVESELQLPAYTTATATSDP